jgi:hypothetical protein
MRINPGLALALIAAYGATAAADDFKPPPMKDGLWEAHTVQVMGGKTMADMVIKMCQTKELTASSEAFAKEMRKTNQCTSTVTQTGNTVVEDSHCTKGPTAGDVSHTVYSHVGDTASHVEMRMHIGGTETSTVSDMKYLGSCPAGIKPGDVIMPDGKVVSGR